MEAPEPPGAVENRLNRLLGTIVEGSVARLGFDAATVTARHDGNVATVLTSDQRYIALDDAQYETGEGPCLDALTRLDPIYLRDADQARERWPHFAQTAQHLGVRSTLSLHLPVQEGRLAASMNLYATQTLDLDDDQIAAAASVGEPVAEALKVAEAYRAAVRLAENLAEAMRSRAIIEQAKGMLMAENHVNADDAFALLTGLSQRANRKLREVARELVERRSGHPALPIDGP
jgi:GAF domain-containing protein